MSSINTWKVTATQLHHLFGRYTDFPVICLHGVRCQGMPGRVQLHSYTTLTTSMVYGVNDDRLQEHRPSGTYTELSDQHPVVHHQGLQVEYSCTALRANIVVTNCNVDVKSDKISLLLAMSPLFAGLTYTLKPTKTGFELTAKGYNEKMPKFLLTIVDAIYALDLSEGWTKVLYFY